MKTAKSYLPALLMTAALTGIGGCHVKKATSTIAATTARRQVSQYTGLPANTRDSLYLRRASLFQYRAEFFTKNDLQALLAQKGCIGIRTYRALNEYGQIVTYIVGVSATGDLVPKPTVLTLQKAGQRSKDGKDSSVNSANLEGIVLKSDVPCPQVCPGNGF